MKTNKSFTKRIKVTKNGKLVTRKAGQNHFNAKEGGRSQMKRNRTLAMVMKNKAKSRFLSTSTI
jgi:ribosomal protein L35